MKFYYSFYHLKCDNSDFSLSSVLNSLPSEHEVHLREALARKIEKNSLVDTIFSFNQDFQSYVTSSDNHILCLTVDQISDSLDLFRYELDLFTKELLVDESINQIESKLSNWYEKCVTYLSRSIDNLADKLGYFIEAALSGEQIECQNELSLFYETITCKSLIQDKNNAKIAELNNENSSKPLSKLVSKCIEELKEAKNDPFKQKEILEQVKLTIIQDLNTFNRLLRRAEDNYYDFYVLVNFVKNTKNGSILLKLYKKDSSTMKAIEEILAKE